MLSDYLNLHFEVKGKTIKGFCMRIYDDFHLTYAVILEDYHSFCIWLDDKTANWCHSKYTNIDRNILDGVIGRVKELKIA